MAWTPASSSARRFHSPESSPNHSNIHSWVPSGLVANPSRDMTILRTTFRSLMPVETYPLARTHRRRRIRANTLASGASRRRGDVRERAAAAGIRMRVSRDPRAGEARQGGEELVLEAWVEGGRVRRAASLVVPVAAAGAGLGGVAGREPLLSEVP